MKCIMRTLRKLLLLSTLIIVATGIVFFWPKSHDAMPALETGDIILQSHQTPQAWPIAFATSSLYSHTGIIIKQSDGSYHVLDSAGEVKESPFEEWIQHGHGQQFAIYRDTRLSSEEKQQLVDAAKEFYGMPYDYVFLFDNNSLYCSELPYRMYHKLGLSIGKVEKVGDLNVNNPLVEWLIESRWQMHPHCVEQKKSYKACRELVMQQELISPASIARDPNMKQIYSNYWF